jgi:putative ABC transport system ATP-binding protein
MTVMDVETSVAPAELNLDPNRSSDGLAVRCDDIVKTYGTGSSQVVALRGIDLDVKAGELLMLVGPSGCGKTTLISVIAGILDPDSGECHVFGQDLPRMGNSEKTRYRGRTIGFVFQAFNLLPTLTAAENASVPLLINGMKRREAVERAKDMLSRVGLGDRTNAMPSQLSGGQQQRVAIARALVHGPRLIVCDEPTSALDEKTGHTVMELMREIALGEDRSLIVVTHDARIFGFADRIAKMNDGRVEKVVQSAAEL